MPFDRELDLLSVEDSESEPVWQASPPGSPATVSPRSTSTDVPSQCLTDCTFRLDGIPSPKDTTGKTEKPLKPGTSSAPHAGPTGGTVRASHWAFTSYGLEPQEVVSRIRESGIASYVVAGSEVCPSTGRKHSQCYLQTKTSCRRAKLSKILTTAHFEPARGSPEQNRAYCIKDGKFLEDGAMRSMKRGGAETQATNWAELVTWSKAGRLEEIADKYPNLFLARYHTIRAIWKDYQPPCTDSPWTRGVWIQGPSGCGKSSLARRIYPRFYAKMANKWFDGYQGEPYVILDDVGPDQAKTLTYHLKIWCDRYAFVAEIKNGSRMIAPMGFVITSQYSIEYLWSDTETRDALRRRCTVIELDDVRSEQLHW